MRSRTFRMCTMFTFTVESCGWLPEPKRHAAYIGNPLDQFEIYYKEGDVITLWHIRGNLWADVSGCVFRSGDIKAFVREGMMAELPLVSNLLPPPR